MANHHGEPRLLAQLEITYDDGSTETVATDPGKWTTADGPTTYDSLYTGDSYDGRIAATLAGYDEAGFDSGDWFPAVEMAPPGSCPEAACAGFIPDEPPTPEGFVPAELHAQESDPVQVVGDVEVRGLEEVLGRAPTAEDAGLITARTVRTAYRETGEFSTGEVPEIVPAPKGWYGYEGTPGWASTEGPTPSWDAAYFVMPWELYQYSGDVQLLRDMYPTQQRFMDYYGQWFNAGNGYAKPANVVELGDWAATGGLGTKVINQQWNYYFADYMAKVGELIGEDEAAAQYRTRADEILTWFVDQYWDPATHSYRSTDADANVETMNVMAIELGMVPGSDLDPAHAAYRADEQAVAANEASAADVVAADITSRGFHLGAGVFGMHYLFNVLDEFGHTDVLYQVATQTETPSWGFQIGQGSTALWEQWDSGSQNHPYQNSIGTWFCQGLGGITPAEPGYRSVLIKPFIPTVEGTSSVPPFADGAAPETSTLDEVEASIDTARGTVASSWSRNSDGTIKLTVTIPGNTPAEVWVPTMDKEVRAPSGLDPSGTDVAGGKPYAVFDVPPGTYTFNG
jgi:alpha-L-rhamnosidase